MSIEEHSASESGQNEQAPQSPSAPATAGDRRLPKRHTRLALVGLIALLIFGGLVFAAVRPRLARQKKITTAAQAIRDNIPVVNVVQAQQAPASSDLQLPGDVEAIQVAAVSAQTTGYLRNLHADIGDRVRARQLLAEIDTPQVDQQLQEARANLAQSVASLGQAEANLNQAVANVEYARVTYERNQYLAQQHVVSDQVRDQMKTAYDAALATVAAMQANINAAKAAIASSEANVRSLIALQGFQKVFSPFAGIITARNVEIGSLISPGSSSVSSSVGTTASSATLPGTGTTSQGTNAPAASGGLFEIARIDTLRIFISVPQAFASTIKPGQTATISIRELPEKTFAGRVVRTTSALDPGSRTLLTEVQIPNSNNQLLPGMYATVSFGVQSPDPAVRIPATALIIHAEGPQVAMVTGDQKVHYRKVVIGRDYGNELDIISGLEPGATIIVNVADGLQEGAQVQTQAAPSGNQTRNPANNPAPKQGRQQTGS
ncbi:MAG: efflux RND transporter periplasmic adaptor subunit [Pyrinomonadaceae bacterium]|nr:efflux RND transporter periplasmic adaptor subunit [Pyrinomonadaceae bacterium]